MFLREENYVEVLFSILEIMLIFDTVTIIRHFFDLLASFF